LRLWKCASIAFAWLNHRAGPVQGFCDGNAQASPLCKSNLHHLLCRLSYQVQQRGLTAQFLEHWVERLIGEMKKLTKNRIHSEPEKLMLSAVLFTMACERLKTATGWAEPVKAGVDANDAGASTGVGALLGKPSKPMKKEEWAKIKGKVQAELVDQRHPAWEDDEAWSNAVVQTYKRAVLPNTGHEVTSKAYERRRSRIGYYVMQNWTCLQEKGAPWSRLRLLRRSNTS
jgi:hypothetical protein